MRKVYLLALLFLVTISLWAKEKGGEDEMSPMTIQKDFKGILKYIEYTPFDTTYYKVYISDGRIRVDLFENKDQQNEAEKITIYDFRQKKILALKPSEHIYKTLEANEEQNVSTDGCVLKPNIRNYKIINGYKCVQYRVKNKSENTDVTYWIPEEEFPFYYKMVSMKKSMHRYHKYFYVLPNYEVAFPMQITERSLFREVKSSIKVVEIDEAVVSDQIFQIPEGYTLNE